MLRKRYSMMDLGQDSPVLCLHSSLASSLLHVSRTESKHQRNLLSSTPLFTAGGMAKFSSALDQSHDSHTTRSCSPGANPLIRIASTALA